MIPAVCKWGGGVVPGINENEECHVHAGIRRYRGLAATRERDLSPRPPRAHVYVRGIGESSRRTGAGRREGAAGQSGRRVQALRAERRIEVRLGGGEEALRCEEDALCRAR